MNDDMITAFETDYEPNPIRLDSPEDVIIDVILLDSSRAGSKDWRDYTIEGYNVLPRNPNVCGAASYEVEYGSFLDFTIQQLIDPPGEGYFTVVGITGTFIKGDGWMTDDDMDFYYEEVRPSTPEEIAMF